MRRWLGLPIETRTLSEAAPCGVRAPTIGLRCDNPAGQQAGEEVANWVLAFWPATTPKPPQVAPTSTPVLNHNAIQRGEP